MGTGSIILLGALALLITFIAVMLYRASKFALPIPPADIVDLPEVDGAVVGEKLAEAIRCETVSVQGEAKEDPASYDVFRELHKKLEEMFPKVHETLSLTKINNYSLLYEWKGSDEVLKPVLYMAHQDVVPVDPATLPEWEHPPFSGAIADGFVWGRGTADIKEMLITELEAAEQLIGEGFAPKRTIYFAFGHDEEIGGVDGAQMIVKYLKETGVELAAVIDEGGVVSPDVLGEMPTNIAVIGTSEKGIINLEISVEGEPGHSSTPPQETAIGILSKALAKVEANPLPAHPEAMVPMMRHFGNYVSFGQRLALANLWILRGVISKMLAKDPTMNASIRTTTAITMISGGVKENVLAREAKANVNFRLLPGDTIEGLIVYVKSVIADERVTVKEGSEFGTVASPISPDDGEAFLTLAGAIRDVFGGIPVAPYTMMGGSDSRHYTSLSPNVFRFIPAVLPKAELAGIHADNERISLENLSLMTQFFMHMIRVWDEAEL